MRRVVFVSVIVMTACSAQGDDEETALVPTPRVDSGTADSGARTDAASAPDAAPMADTGSPAVADAGPPSPADATAPVDVGADAGAPRDASVAIDARVDAGAPVVDSAVPFEAGPLLDAGTIAWNVTASQADPPGTRRSFFCGANPSQTGTSSVWGTDVYSYDSSICKAGVHAGKITYAAGGAVRIEMRGDAARFTGSSRNGVTTESWPLAAKSFVFQP